MTTKTDDIKLPSLPVAVPWHKGYDRESLESYARAAVEANRREYLDTLKLARAIVNAHRKDNPPEDSIEADRQGRMPSDDERGTSDPIAGLPRAQSVSDEMMDLVDRLGSEYDEVDPRAWEHLLVYAPRLSRYGSSQPAAEAVLRKILQVVQRYLPPDGIDAHQAMGEIIALVDPWPLSGQPAASAEVAHGLLQQFFDALDDALSKERASPWTGLKGEKFRDRMLAWDRVKKLRGQLLAAPVAQGPVAYLACNPETGEPVWSEGCICKDNVYSMEDTGTIGRPVFFAPVAAQSKVTDEMVTRFLGWHLPQDFAPDAGISFNPSPDPHSWPVGTNLLTDPQARAMLEYVLQGATVATSAKQEQVEDILMPVSQMAGAPWNILDDSGARVMIAGTIDGSKWTFYPELAKRVVEFLNGTYTPATRAQPWQALAAAIYQAAGAYDMPVRILDALSAAANGEQFAHLIDGLLPVESPVTQEPVGEVFTMEPLDGSGDVRSHVLLTKDLPAGTKVYAEPVAAQDETELYRLRRALVYVAHALHGTPQHQLAEGIQLVTLDNGSAVVRVSMDGWTVEVSNTCGPAQAQPCDHVYEARPIDGTTRASAQCEPVCRKCGYRPAARAAKGES